MVPHYTHNGLRITIPTLKFCHCFLLLSIMFVRFTHVVFNNSLGFFHCLLVFHCVKYHNFFLSVLSPVDRYMSYLQFGMIMNKVAMNTLMDVFDGHTYFFLLEISMLVSLQWGYILINP